MSERNPVIRILAEKRDAALKTACDNAEWAATSEKRARDYRAAEAAANRVAASCEQAIADITAADNRRVIYGREVLK